MAAAVAAARGAVVYVGSAGGIDSKRMLAPLLREAARLHAASSSASSPNASAAAATAAAAAAAASSSSSSSTAYPRLVIFGMGWQGQPEFAPYWAGVLPHTRGALSAVYTAAAAVLGATVSPPSINQQASQDSAVLGKGMGFVVYRTRSRLLCCSFASLSLAHHFNHA